LSRTAKNQKDFKVEALNQWRKDADFACLVAPLYQYPNKNSQVYTQATRYKVTLLSYTHLSYLIKNATKIMSSGKLQKLWEVPKSCGVTSKAQVYWKAIDQRMIKLTGTKPKNWQDAVAEEMKRLPQKAKEQIAYWDSEKETYC
jgi:type II restriction enzyme